MINRKKSWKGMAFPGGHLENGESLVDCAIREIWEETGLRINTVQYKGNVLFFNTKTQEKHMICNYLCEDFEGVLKHCCNEGILTWVEVDEFRKMPLAEGMELRFDLFLQPGIYELYIEWEETRGYTKIERKRIG